MENDDLPVGRILSRREVIALLGVGGAGLVGAWRVPGGHAPALTSAPGWPGGVPACVVRPEQTEGPYFVDEHLNRADIRSDPASGAIRPGAALDLEFRVARVTTGSCAPLAGAIVDLWHCDALGVYSDVKDMSGKFDTRGQKFLRGHQLTDASGIARFHTVYPGWYEGRTVHLHVKIRTPAGTGGSHEFTSQLYFDDAVTDTVFAREPYKNQGVREMRNNRDGIFSEGGKRLLIDVTPAGNGYTGTFEIGLQMA